MQKKIYRLIALILAIIIAGVAAGQVICCNILTDPQQQDLSFTQLMETPRSDGTLYYHYPGFALMGVGGESTDALDRIPAWQALRDASFTSMKKVPAYFAYSGLHDENVLAQFSYHYDSPEYIYGLADAPSGVRIPADCYLTKDGEKYILFVKYWNQGYEKADCKDRPLWYMKSTDCVKTCLPVSIRATLCRSLKRRSADTTNI